MFGLVYLVWLGSGQQGSLCSVLERRAQAGVAVVVAVEAMWPPNIESWLKYSSRCSNT